MRSLLLLACLATSTATATEPRPAVGPARPSPELTGVELYRRVLPSVVTLTVRREQGDGSVGTAFMAAGEGLALTAWHVVRDAAAITATFSNGEEFEVSGLVDKDERRDLALVRIKVAGRPLLPLAVEDPAIGTRAYVVGTPKGLEFSLSDGIVGQVRMVQGLSEIQFTCPASPGNSGGPLLAGSGQVLGIVSWQVREGQNLNFAIPARYGAGLDATLPTRPWGSAGAREERPSTASAAIDDAIRGGLADSEDAVSFGSYLYRVRVKEPGGFKAPLPPAFYSVARQLVQSRSALEQARTDDPRRNKARQALTQALARLEASYARLKGALDLAYRGNGWSRDAKNELSQSIAELPSLEASETAVAELQQEDPAFAKRSPGWFKERLERAEPKLLISVWARSTLSVIDVEEGGLGEEIGLKPGDQIVLAAAREPRSLAEFKEILRERKEQQVLVVVQREGKRKALRWTASWGDPVAAPSE